MKKIIIDARFWGSSNTGLGRYTESLLTSIHQLKPKQEISLLVSKSSQRQIRKTLPKFNLITCSSPYYSIGEQLEIPQLIRSYKPDLTHFLHFNVPLKTPTPFIVTIHDLIKHHSTGPGTTTKSRFTYPVKRLAYHQTVKSAVSRSQLIFTPTAWVKKDILSFFPQAKAKIIVTPEAAPKNYFKPVSKSHFYPKYPYLIYIGNAYPHKNILQLIKAVQKFTQDKKKPLKLVIVTARNVFYQRLRLQIRILKAQNIIKLKNFTSDNHLKTLYRHSVGFITASLQEGFGLPGLEAMASKTLVLSSNKTCLPEVYGSNASYFNPDNLDEIVNKIDKAYSLDAAKRLTRINKAYNYAKKFSWEKTAQLTLNGYQQVLNNL